MKEFFRDCKNLYIKSISYIFDISAVVSSSCNAVSAASALNSALYSFIFILIFDRHNIFPVLAPWPDFLGGGIASYAISSPNFNEFM